MYLLTLTLPLLSFLLIIFFGRFLGNVVSSYIAVLSMTISLLLAILLFIEVSLNNANCYIFLTSWISCDLLSCSWSFIFDDISTIMLLVVCFVSTIVHLYSLDYMKFDPHQSRFVSYLSLFTFFMLVLISSDNFLVLFFGWEGIGLSSYLLISFWYTRVQAGKSAIKAMVVNRIGDYGIILSFCIIFITFKSFEFHVIFPLAICAIYTKTSFFLVNTTSLVAISFFLLWGAVGKSAQLGLHIWLPDAMEAPTPVSALLHAATLVTAGVFLIIRCSFFFEQSPVILMLTTLIGSLTAFFASATGLVQNDLKRVIAYSTCSQIGYMIFSCGLSEYSIAFFHLWNHAIFKALLFLSAGCIIHGLEDEQDLRKMGSFRWIFPVSYIMFLIGSIALTAFPFFTGFYSKDAILESAVSRYNWIGNFSYLLGSFSAVFTAYYSTRLVLLTFFNKTNSSKQVFSSSHEASITMLFPLFFLCIGSIFAGFFSQEFFIGISTPIFSKSIFLHNHATILDSESLSFLLKFFPFFGTIFGLFACYFILSMQSSLKSRSFVIDYIQESYFFKQVYIFLLKKWHFDQIFVNFIAHNITNFGDNVSFLLLDKGIFEKIGAFGLSLQSHKNSLIYSVFHSGKLSTYLSLIAFSLLTFFFLFFFSLINCFNCICILFCYMLFFSLIVK